MGRSAASVQPPRSAFALANTGADQARRWLSEQLAAQRERGVPTALTAHQQSEISRVLTMDWWQSAVSEGETHVTTHTDLLAELLPAAVRAAATIPFASTALALYLRNLVNEAWELSWDHRLVRSAVNWAVTAAEDQPQDAADEVAWRLLRFMNAEFHVESALLTGNFHAVRTVTSDAVRLVAPIADAARALEAHPARAVLIAEASGEHRYYQAVHDIARATHALLTREDFDASAELARISGEIAQGRFRPTDASELRGHLASLESVSAATGQDWLHIEEGRVRIVYGFGIHQPQAEDVLADLGALRDAIDARGVGGGRLGPLRIEKTLRRLPLSDVWQGSDSLGRGYRGSTVHLEEMTLSAVRDDELEPIQSIATSIQISELGNHTVIFDIPLEDAAAYEIAQTINLATPVYGDLTEIPRALRLHPSKSTDARLVRLADVAGGIIDDLRDMLRALRRAPKLDPISARAGSFGVIITIEQAYRDASGRRTALASARELLELWGTQPLLHPLPAGASGVADWTMYDVDSAKRYDLLHLNDELLVANSNVTLLASFRSPDYAVSEVESFITFAHSMHGMHQAWQSAVREHAEKIAGLLVRVERELLAADQAATASDEQAHQQVIDDLGELVRTIERAELTLQSFVQSQQATMLFVESPAIVTSPALRTDLDTILASNRYDLLRTGFERAVRDVLGTRLQPLLEVCHRRIALALESRQAAREHRTERLAQVLGVILAVVGVSGLVSVLQEGLGLHGEITWWFFAAILLAAVALGAAMAIAPRVSWRGLLRLFDRKRPRS